MITITPKDAKRSQNLPPGWQIVKVENMYTKPSGTDGSTNYFYELLVLDGQFKDTPLQELVVNEKAVSMHKNFFIACGAPSDLWDKAIAGEAQTFDERNPIGKIIQVMVTPTKFDNRMLNKPGDFLALTNEQRARYEAVV